MCNGGIQLFNWMRKMNGGDRIMAQSTDCHLPHVQLHGENGSSARSV